MNDEPIPFRNKPYSNGASHDEEALDDAIEVTLDTPSSAGCETARLPEADLPDESLLEVALEFLPVETQRHLRAAGRETALFATSLAGNLLKGVAVTLNAVAEALNTYTERHANVTDLEAARQRRRPVNIEVE
jgi:hypothetical protein